MKEIEGSVSPFEEIEGVINPLEEIEGTLSVTGIGTKVTMEDNPEGGVDLTVTNKTRTLAKEEDIPKKLSELENDSDFTTSADLDELAESVSVQLDTKADKSEIPTIDVDKEYVDEQNALQDRELNAVKSDVDDHEERIDALENKPSGGGNVDDVQINGTSILVDKVANIPVAGQSIYGVVSLGGNGILNDKNGRLQVQSAGQTLIASRSTSAFVSAGHIDTAVKAAMCDGKGAEWTEAEKAKAQERMGIVVITQEEYDLLEVKGEKTIYIIT